MARIYGTASERANQWLLDQWYSQWQLNDAYDKIREKQNQWMSSFDIMDDIRQNRKDYIDNPMYWNPNSYDDYDDYGGWGWEDRYEPTWEEKHPAVSRNVWGRDFNLQTHEDWSITVTTWGKERTIDKNHSQYETISNYLNGITSKQTSKNPNTTGNESGIWDQVTWVRDSKWWADYDNRVDANLKKWMSREDAFNEASEWMKRDTISSSKQDKEAELQWPKKDDDAIDNNTLIVDQVPTDEATEGTKYNKNEDPTNWEMDSNWLSDEDRETIKSIFGFYPEEVNDYMNGLKEWGENLTNSLNSQTTQSQVTNTAKVPRDSSFDYNTYFQENLSWPKHVWKTWEVKNKITQGPLTDIKSYQDEATTALQNLWFLQPDTQAAESMPDTVEETAPKMVDNPEQLINEFDSKMDEMANTTGITPQAVATTYTDYKNQLAKYIRENKISDEEAAAMFDQLKKNEKFRNLLTQTNK